MKTNRQAFPRIFSFVPLIVILLFFSSVSGEASLAPSVVSEANVHLMGEQKVSIDRQPSCHRYRPQVAYNNDHNEYLVVWHNTWDNGDRYVYARRLDINGNPIGDPFPIHNLLNVKQVHPNVVYNGTSEVYLVVWMRDVTVSGGSTRYEIWGTILDWDASSIGTPFIIGDWSAPNSLWYPSVAWNSVHNEYLVIWDTHLEGSSANSPQNIGYRKVDADTSLGASGTITIHGEPTESDLAFNLARDEYMVVWARLTNHELEPPGIYGARLDHDANIVGADFDIFTSSYIEGRNPAIATNEQNRYYVAYQWLGTMTNGNIQLLDVFGDPVNSRELWAAFNDRDQPPDVAVSGMNSWTVAYSGRRASDEMNWIAGSLFYDLSNPNTDLINYTIFSADWNRRNVAVAGGNNGYLLVYENRSTELNSRQHIYATKIWQSGIFLPVILK